MLYHCVTDPHHPVLCELGDTWIFHAYTDFIHASQNTGKSGFWFIWTKAEHAWKIHPLPSSYDIMTVWLVGPQFMWNRTVHLQRATFTAASTRDLLCISKPHILWLIFTEILCKLRGCSTGSPCVPSISARMEKQQSPSHDCHDNWISPEGGGGDRQPKKGAH